MTTHTDTESTKTGAELFELLAGTHDGAQVKFTALCDDYSIVHRWEYRVLDIVRGRTPFDLPALRDLLRDMAKENHANRIQIWAEIPNTIHDETTGNGDIDHEVNARHIVEMYGSFDGKGFFRPDSDIRVFNTQFSSSVYALIFDGRNGIGLDIEVPDDLYDAIGTLARGGQIKDSETRHAIEQEIIDRDWDNWGHHEVIDKLSQETQDEWAELTTGEQKSALGEALGRMYRLTAPRFDGDSWSVDSDKLAQHITQVMNERTTSTKNTVAQ